MKRSIIAFGFLFLGSLSLATAQKEQGFRILKDDYSSLQIEFTPGTPQVDEVTLADETFSTLAIEGYQQSLANYGDPALPTFSRLIEVPLCEGFDVEVTNASYDTLPALKYRLMPVQLPRRKSDTSAFRLFISQAYSQNHFLGQKEALVEAVGVARNRNLARLQFSPVTYNPVNGQVIVCRHATVTVRYRGVDKEGTLEMFNRYYSPAFNSGANTINSLYPKSVRTTAPVRYLIVANSMFRGHLDTFVQWKQRKGFRVDVAYTDNPSVGTDTNSISNYIKSLYTNATTTDPAPTYVLLVGDVAQLPAFSYHVLATSSLNPHVTDLYYMTWTTGDHIPDCHYGRFSAQNISQLTPQIEKTLMYEQYTFADPSFLDRAVMVAGVDGGSNGYNYGDPAMDYAVTNYVNGTHSWSQVMYYKNDVSIVPSVTTNVTVGSSASGNAATIRNYYNQGAALINYSAHGSATSWSTPNFSTTHVASMTNNQKFGLMIGNCCLSNKFDESTCLGESLLRKDEYAGAVGYIGGSNSTYWGQDFYWAVGVRSSVGPSMSMAYNASNLGVYDRTFHTHNESHADWCTTQGSMIMQGNMAVESSSSGSSMKWYYWEIYHLMGDPSVMPYMTQAEVMTVTVVPTITYGTTDLSVSAVPYAYVALTDTVTRTLIAAAYADANGDAQLTLPADLSVGSYLLAASAQQYRTAFRPVSIIQPAGAFPVVTAISSDPLNAGDTVALTLHVENIGNTMARNISIQLASSNPQLTFSTTTVSLDSLEAGASADLSSIVSAIVNGNTPDNTPTDLSTSTSWTGGTLAGTSSFRLWLYAPVLSLTFSNTFPDLLPGNSSTITATLHNSGHAPARANTLSFSSPTALLSVLHSPFSNPLAANATASIPVTLQSDARLPQNIIIPVACRYASLNDTLPIFIGELDIETFEGGTTHCTGWNTAATYPWAASTEQPFEGSYCLRSAQNLDHKKQSDISFNTSLTSADSVSFYYRVSSENGYDKFFFLIDSVEMLDASGEMPWTHAAFFLPAGSHILTFRYKKDYSVSNGSDCAWIDNVVLPHQSHPVMFIHRDTCLDNTPSPQTSVAANGDVTIIDYTAHPSYNLSTQISACDSLLWNGNEYTSSVHQITTLPSAYGCDSIVGIAITINHSSAGDTLQVSTAATSYEWYGTVYETSGTYQQLFVNSQGCDSTVTLVLTIGTQGIDGIDTESLTLYPNPTTGWLQVSQEVDEVTVYDLTGRVVAQQRKTTVVDLGSLAPGIYTLRLTDSGSTAIQRVVKQ